jgi:hypothetical protein
LRDRWLRAEVPDRPEQPQAHHFVGVSHRDQRGQVRSRRSLHERHEHLPPVVRRSLEDSLEVDESARTEGGEVGAEAVSSSSIGKAPAGPGGTTLITRTIRRNRSPRRERDRRLSNHVLVPPTQFATAQACWDRAIPNGT